MNPDHHLPCQDNPYVYDAALDRTAGPAYRDAAVRVAKAICGGCEERDACLRENRDAPGIVAGRTRAERRTKPRRAARQGRAVAQCGTRSGAKAHRRKGEPVCGECRAECSDYQRGIYARKRSAA